MSAARTELKALWRLAVPIVVANLGTQLMPLVDAMFVGKHSDAGLRAMTLAHVWIFGTSMLVMGVVFGMDPIVAQSHGAGDGERVGRTLQRGLVLAALLGVPLALAWGFTDHVLIWIYHLPGVHTPDDIHAVAALAQRYAEPQMWTAPSFLAFLALRQYLQGRGILAPVVLVLLVSNVFNAIFDAYWIPEHGVYGAGIATALTRLLFPLLLWAAIVRGGHHRGAWVPWTRRALHPGGLLDIVRIGVPIGIQLSLEVWAFGACTLMAGALGEAATNAHSAVLHMASITFMLPMGVALAATTRVGNLLGERRKQQAQTTSWIAFAVGAGVMALAAATFFLGRHALPHVILRRDSAEALALATAILPIAAAFQVFDGLQVVGSGVLRGMGTTRPAAIANLIGYWVIALPLGYWLAFHAGWGLPGVWWGLVLALGLVAILLLTWIRWNGPATLDDRRLLTRESG